MKKIIIVALSLGVFAYLGTPAMAKNVSGSLPVPDNLTTVLYPESICFSWNPSAGAAKYSLDIDVSVDRDGDQITDRVVEFSFGTGDRTDGREPSDPDLCVPLSDFVFDLDGNGTLDQVFGPAHVKVKALNPGKGNGRQNNAFSAGVDTSLIDQDLPSDPLPPPDPLLSPPAIAFPDPLTAP